MYKIWILWHSRDLNLCPTELCVIKVILLFLSTLYKHLFHFNSTLFYTCTTFNNNIIINKYIHICKCNILYLYIGRHICNWQTSTRHAYFWFKQRTADFCYPIIDFPNDCLWWHAFYLRTFQLREPSTTIESSNLFIQLIPTRNMTYVAQAPTALRVYRQYTFINAIFIFW